METKLRKARHISSRTIAGEVFIIHAKTQELFNLTGTAVDLWNWVDGTRTQSDLVEKIIGAYDVPKATAQADVRSFVERLLKDDILEIREP